MAHSARIVAASADAIEAAAERLQNGGLVAFPTETVYGLGADATNETAVASIFEAKQRPAFNPLICHFSSAEKVDKMMALAPAARKLADEFWPGSLSIILPRPSNCPIARLASAGLDTIAARVPDHSVAQQLLDLAGVPIAAPSANRSGRLSPTRAEDVLRSLGDIDLLVLDGGACRVGVESSVVSVNQDGRVILLREGGIGREEISDRAGLPVEILEKPDEVRSPGMLARHYQPTRPLRLNASSAREDELFLGFGPLPVDAPLGSETLSETGDLREAAARLFALLHDMETRECTGIAVAAIPEEGLGRAINDRLRRGADTDD